MTAVKENDRNDSRPFVPPSPSNGIESVRGNYIAKNPQNLLYDMCQNDMEKINV